jgi:FkbM family methyltransferase
MKKIVRLLRRNKTLNALVRRLLMKSRRFLDRAITYWPVSGTIEFKSEDLSVTLYARADDGLTSRLYYQKNWESSVLPWFTFFSRTSGVIVDVGANIGLYSLLAIKANDRAEVYAFEPNPNNVDRLKVNLGLNKAEDRIKILPYATGAGDGEVQLYLPAESRISDVSSVYGSHTRSFNDFEHTSMTVRSVSLDSFFGDSGRKIDLVKIDVELYELYVLKGMTKILLKDRPIVFCEIFNDVIKRKLNPMLDADIHSGHTLEIAALLNEYGYSFYSITSQGLIEVPDFYYSPMSSMYLLVPKKLTQKHYLYTERHLIESQL